jgi:hypothetical protein
MVERAYRAGYLNVAQVEYSVRISAKLRRRACCLIGTKAGNMPFPRLRAALLRSSPGRGRSQVRSCNTPVIFLGPRSRAASSDFALRNFTLLLTKRLR